MTSVDLNTTEIASDKNRYNRNVKFIDDDIAEMQLGKDFDIVLCVGVIHHTDDPDRTVENIKKHVKPGGKMILWVYSDEGNFLVKWVVEPLRKLLLNKLRREKILVISKIITLLLYLPIFSIYLLPLNFLPYYKYFNNFRKLSFYRNTLNIFDKLNSPQVQFITKNRVKSWVPKDEFENIHISTYNDVSWRISAVKW